MPKKLIVIGAGGHGKVIIDIALKMNTWNQICFLDDSTPVQINGVFPVVGRVNEALNHKNDADFFVAIGSNVTRRRIHEWLENHRCHIATLIHPSAILANDVVIGVGSVVMANVVINSSTIVKKGCIINTSSSIDHDNIIGQFVHVSPGVRIAGGVEVGDDTWLGIGSITSNNVTICEHCIIGAGAVVINDIKVSGKYVGNPARKID